MTVIKGEYIDRKTERMWAEGKKSGKTLSIKVSNVVFRLLFKMNHWSYKSFVLQFHFKISLYYVQMIMMNKNDFDKRVHIARDFTIFMVLLIIRWRNHCFEFIFVFIAKGFYTYETSKFVIIYSQAQMHQIKSERLSSENESAQLSEFSGEGQKQIFDI